MNILTNYKVMECNSKIRWLFIVDIMGMEEGDIHNYISILSETVKEWTGTNNTIFIPTRTGYSSINMINIETGKVERFNF